ERDLLNLVTDIKAVNGPLPIRLAGLMVTSYLFKENLDDVIANNKYFRKGLVKKALQTSQNPIIQKSFKEVMRNLEFLKTLNGSYFEAKEGEVVNEYEVVVVNNLPDNKVKFTMIPGVKDAKGKVLSKAFVMV